MMGVENGNECFCGSEADNPTRYGLCSSVKNDCECDHQCTGNKEQVCGGDWAISIYYIGMYIKVELSQLQYSHT